MECPFHKVIADPDPHDWFNDDDMAVVCTKMPNDKQNKKSLYAAERQEFRTINVAMRPYQIKKENIKIPTWCPL